MSKQPNALRLADLLDKIPSYGHTPTDTAAAAELRRQHALLEEMAGALQQITLRYVGLVDSGDAGNWDPETEVQVIDARAVLAKWEASKS